MKQAAGAAARGSAEAGRSASTRDFAVPCPARNTGTSAVHGTRAALGTILIDMRGAILRCSNAIAELGQWLPKDIAGIPVKALLPALPLHAGTMGYNLAYASFHSSRSLPMRIAARDGGSVAVRGSVRVVKADRNIQFLLELERV